LKESRNGLLLVQTSLGSEGQRIDPYQLAVRALAHEPLDAAHNAGIRELSQEIEEWLSFAHGFLLGFEP
jgi:hypothetical protein